MFDIDQPWEATLTGSRCPLCNRPDSGSESIDSQYRKYIANIFLQIGVTSTKMDNSPWLVIT